MKPINDGMCLKCDDNLISYMPLLNDNGSSMEIDVDCPNCGWSIIIKADVVSIKERG
jgi:DNA-directed RNA polymerase subunit RPC12/RpoP